MVTGHGMTKAYLHRFKITQSPECVCANGDQTVDHLIFDCTKLEKEREKLIGFTSREDWPVRKYDVVKKYLNQFKQFTNSIDFEKLVINDSRAEFKQLGQKTNTKSNYVN